MPSCLTIIYTQPLSGSPWEFAGLVACASLAQAVSMPSLAPLLLDACDQDHERPTALALRQTTSVRLCVFFFIKKSMRSYPCVLHAHAAVNFGLPLLCSFCILVPYLCLLVFFSLISGLFICSCLAVEHVLWPRAGRGHADWCRLDGCCSCARRNSCSPHHRGRPTGGSCFVVWGAGPGGKQPERLAQQR